MTIGERIKERRLQIGIEQQKLAKLVGLKKTTISQIESNRSNPSIESLRNIADALNCSTDYLLKGETGKIGENKVAKELLEAFERNGIKKEDLNIKKLEKIIQMYKIMKE